MSGAVQPWKNAATLIIAAKNSATKLSTNLQVKPLSQVSKNILEHFDYKLLILKRSSKSKFMPSACVFPGGLFSSNDCSVSWANMYTEVMGLKSGRPLSVESLGLTGLHSKKPAPMYLEDNGSPLPNEAAFRICAIRETFEESGILICVSPKHVQEGRTSGAVHKPLSLPPDKARSLPTLRKEVNADDGRFLEICKDLGVVPDLWGLVEWSDWLTPTNLPKTHSGRRYDTAFFISFIPEVLDPQHDDDEITHCQWVTPAELLLDYHEGKLLLFPPQIHTLSQLLTVSSWSQAAAASLHQLQHHNIPRILPVRVNYSDGMASLLQGDAMYPECPDVDGVDKPLSVDSPLTDAHTLHSKLHRFEFRGTFDSTLRDTISDPTVPFSAGHGQTILQTLIKELGITVNSTRKKGDISHID